MNDDNRIAVSSLIREAERCFLRKQYSRSLLLVDRYFRSLGDSKHYDDDNNNNNNNGNGNDISEEIIAEETSVRLYPSILLLSKDHYQAEGKKQKIFTFFAAVVDHDEDPQSVSLGPSSPMTQSMTTMTDRLACIGLQSFHELSLIERRQRNKYRRKNNNDEMNNTTACTGRTAADIPIGDDESHFNGDNNDTIDDERWMYIMQILDYYNDENSHHIVSPTSLVSGRRRRPSRALSVELLSIWIPFWEYHGYELQAFVWTIQVLHYYSPTELLPEQPTTTMIVEELWVRCVCEQLPRYSQKNCTFIQLILRLITEISDPVMKCIEWEQIWDNFKTEYVNDTINDDDNNIVVTNTLIDTLDWYLNGSSAITSIDNPDLHDNTLLLRQPSCHRDIDVSLKTLKKGRDRLVQQRLRQNGNYCHTRKNQSTNFEHNNSLYQQESSRVTESLSIEHLNQSRSLYNIIKRNTRISLGDFLSRFNHFLSFPSAKISSKLTSLSKLIGFRAIITIIKSVKIIFFRFVSRYIHASNDGSKQKLIMEFLKSTHLSFSPYLFSSLASNDNNMDTKTRITHGTDLRRQNLIKGTISIIFLLIGWRRRQLLVRAVKTLVRAAVVKKKQTNTNYMG